MTIEPAAVARFKRDVLAAYRMPLAPEDKIGLAVSGGGDSMAMLVLAAAAFPGQIWAATFDHQLRADAAAEAAMVADFCARLGVPHHTLTPDALIRGASIQAQARTARYRGLSLWGEQLGLAMLLTAHHADDQAETFLMRAARGSGVQGLSGVRSRRMLNVEGRALWLVRPLLGWRSAMLRQIAIDEAAPFVDDPSNCDVRHDRSRFRMILAANPDLDVIGLSAAAAFAGEAEATLARIAAATWEQVASVRDGAVIVRISEVEERDQQRRLLRRAIAEVRRMASLSTPEFSDASNVEHMLDSLKLGDAATKAGVKASVRRGNWVFIVAPPRRSH